AAVHAAPLLGSNGGTPEAQEAEAPVAEIDDLPPTSVADFRQALSELFGTPAAPSSVDELLAPPADLVLDALVADEPTFGATVAAVPAAAEVKERIVDGRLLLPLEEIVRQLPPDVFAAIGRGPVEVPGIEGFPVPFKPLGWEEAPLIMAPPPGEPEPLSIEVPDAAEV